MTILERQIRYMRFKKKCPVAGLMALGMEPRASVLGVTCQKKVLLYQCSSLRKQGLKWGLHRTIGGRQCYWADSRVEPTWSGGSIWLRVMSAQSSTGSLSSVFGLPGARVWRSCIPSCPGSRERLLIINLSLCLFKKLGSGGT